MTVEANFDGLVGPTHNYGGLSFGNVASMDHKASLSNPREAALQGLKKMKDLADLGLMQCVLPPHERPYLPALRDLGFSGSDSQILDKVAKTNPQLLRQVSSAAAMWTANAATVSPSLDTKDGRLHITPANLCHLFHRSLEAKTTTRVLRKIFSDSAHFVVHNPLPSCSAFSDEGAANHTRFCEGEGEEGVEFFVFGRYGMRMNTANPQKFPARQTFEACEAIARRHGLRSSKVVYAQQNPQAIDQGVFHNDVASVGHLSTFLYHEDAFVESPKVIEELQKKMQGQLRLLKVQRDQISLELAVKSYLFNSQMIQTKKGLGFIAPEECKELPIVKSFIESLPLDFIRYYDLRQSMRNGGGPACLRLRVVLTEQEKKALLPSVIMNDSLYESLTQWVHKHYREQFSPQDLQDPSLLLEVQTALDELTSILELGSLYSFQTQSPMLLQAES